MQYLNVCVCVCVCTFKVLTHEERYLFDVVFTYMYMYTYTLCAFLPYTFLLVDFNVLRVLGFIQCEIWAFV